MVAVGETFTYQGVCTVADAPPTYDWTPDGGTTWQALPATGSVVATQAMADGTQPITVRMCCNLTGCPPVYSFNTVEVTGSDCDNFTIDSFSLGPIPPAVSAPWAVGETIGGNLTCTGEDTARVEYSVDPINGPWTQIAVPTNGTWTATITQAMCDDVIANGNANANIWVRGRCVKDGCTPQDQVITTTLNCDDCVPFQFISSTNPNELDDGSPSPDWEWSPELTGPWGPAYHRDPNQFPTTIVWALANGAGWIAAQPDGNSPDGDPTGNYVRTFITLTATELANVTSGQLAYNGDQAVNAIYVNGQAQTVSGEQGLSVVGTSTINTADLVAGANEIIFCFDNDQAAGAGFLGISADVIIEGECDGTVDPVCAFNNLENLLVNDIDMPPAIDTINVSTWAQFQNALNSASPGDRIVFQNDIVTSGWYTANGVNGTAANPVVVDGNGFQLRTGEGPLNPVTTIGGAVHPFHHINCNWLMYQNMHWNGNRASIWGPTFGSRFNGDGTRGGCDNITIAGSVSEQMWQQGIKFAFECDNIRIHATEVKHWSCERYQQNGPGNTGLGSSAIYIGEGGQQTWEANNVLIDRCHIHDIGWPPDAIQHSGMCLNLKARSQNITARNNLCENTDTLFTGAITASADVKSHGGADNYLIECNVVRNIGRVPNGFGGEGITIGTDGIVRNNLVYNVETWGIDPLRNFRASNPNLTIDSNTVFNTGSGGIRTTNLDNAGQSGGVVPNVTSTNNIAPSGGQFVGQAADFIDANGGALGEGFCLAETSSIPATAGVQAC